METNQQDQQAKNEVILQMPEGTEGNITPAEEENGNNKTRKKYHSSALYAASMWHNTTAHVKPVHPPIER